MTVSVKSIENRSWDCTIYRVVEVGLKCAVVSDLDPSRSLAQKTVVRVNVP